MLVINLILPQFTSMADVHPNDERIHIRDVDNSWKLGEIPVCRLDFPVLQTCLVNLFSSL